MSENNSIVFENHGLKWNTSEDVEEIVLKISTCTELASLTLTGSSLGVEAAEAIAKALLKKSTLKHIYLHDLFTGRDKHEIPKALGHIFDAIIESKAILETLDLSDNALGPHGMKVMKKFFSVAGKNLKVLILNNNGLGALGSEILSKALIESADAVEKNDTNNNNNTHALQLVELYCGRNRLEDAGAKNISNILECVSTLKILRMPQNGIQHKGIAELCQALTHNPLLECLDLNDNIVTEKGAKSIADFLETLNHLVELDLGDCLLRNGGGVHLSSGLKSTKSSFEKINIAYNELTGDIIRSIVDSLIERELNLKLYIDGNMIGKRGRDAMIELINAQKSIRFDGIENDESTDDEIPSSAEENEEESIAAEFRKMDIS